MRGKQLVVGFAVTAALCASVFAGCGGDSDSDTGTPGTDAGGTVKDSSLADTSKADTSSGPVDSATPCVTDASLTGPVPDADIGDTGATTGACNACAQVQCAAEVAACNAECECVKTISGLFTCFAKGGNIATCGTAVVSGSSKGALPFGTCIFTKCGSACGINFGGGGGDAGPGDASGG